MKPENLDAEPLHCPVEATLALIGGKYKTLILWNSPRERFGFPN